MALQRDIEAAVTLRENLIKELAARQEEQDADREAEARTVIKLYEAEGLAFEREEREAREAFEADQSSRRHVTTGAGDRDQARADFEREAEARREQHQERYQEGSRFMGIEAHRALIADREEEREAREAEPAAEAEAEPQRPAYAVHHDDKQKELQERVDAAKAVGDFDGAKLAGLAKREHQANFERAVWTDLAKKEAELWPGSSAGVEYRAYAQDAREEQESVHDRREQEAAFQATPRQSPVEVDVSQPQGLVWRKDPFREDLARQREAEAIHDLPQDARQQATAAAANREKQAAKTWQHHINIADAHAAGATPYIKEMTGMAFDRQGAMGAAKRWHAVAKAERDRNGETAKFKEAVEHRDVAARAVDGLTKRMVERQADEKARGGSGKFELVPVSARRVSTARAVGSSRERPPFPADLKEAILANKRMPQEVRPTQAQPREEARAATAEARPQAEQGTAKATLPEVTATTLRSRVEGYRERAESTEHQGPRPPQGTTPQPQQKRTPQERMAAQQARYAKAEANKPEEAESLGSGSGLRR